MSAQESVAIPNSLRDKLVQVNTRWPAFHLRRVKAFAAKVPNEWVQLSPSRLAFYCTADQGQHYDILLHFSQSAHAGDVVSVTLQANEEICS